MFQNVLIKQFRSKFVISAYVAVLGASATLAAASSLRVIGGRDATANELPYVVRLELEVKQKHTTLYFHLCTCSVLTAVWTLTARHCVDNSNDDESTLAFRNQIDNLEHTTNDSFIRHRAVIRYGNPTGKLNDSQISAVLQTRVGNVRYYGIMSEDITLLKTEPIQLRQYGKVSSMNYESLLYTQMTAVGYGITNGTVAKQSEPLLVNTLVLNRSLQVVVGMLKRCASSIKIFSLLCLSQACARPTALCGGDSGGPVIHRSGIVAVNSRAPVDNNCQMKSDMFRDTDFVYVEALSPYLDWINKVVNSE